MSAVTLGLVCGFIVCAFGAVGTFLYWAQWREMGRPNESCRLCGREVQGSPIDPLGRGFRCYECASVL